MKLIRLISSVLAGLAIATGSALSQTSTPATNSAAGSNNMTSLKTNGLANASADVQLAAVRKALPQYFKISVDPVTDHKTVELLDYDRALGLNGASLTYDVVCFMGPDELVPREISIQFINRAEEWEFLRDSDFLIRFDTNRLDLGSLKVDGTVRNDGTVLEQMYADFSLEQFHKIAWADDVAFKIGWRNFSFRAGDRQKWKLLWKYFDLLQPAPTNSAVGF